MDDVSRLKLLKVLGCVLSRLFGEGDSKLQLPTDQAQCTVFDAQHVPSISIESYFARLAQYTHCSAECWVLALANLNRALDYRPHLHLSGLNIHRLLLTSLLCATKSFDDLYCSNAHFAKVGGVSTKELNRLEIEFLALVNFDVFVQPAVYAEFCREICAPKLHTDCDCDSVGLRTRLDRDFAAWDALVRDSLPDSPDPGPAPSLPLATGAPVLTESAATNPPMPIAQASVASDGGATACAPAIARSYGACPMEDSPPLSVPLLMPLSVPLSLPTSLPPQPQPQPPPLPQSRPPPQQQAPAAVQRSISPPQLLVFVAVKASDAAPMSSPEKSGAPGTTSVLSAGHSTSHPQLSALPRARSETKPDAPAHPDAISRSVKGTGEAKAKTESEASAPSRRAPALPAALTAALTVPTTLHRGVAGGAAGDRVQRAVKAAAAALAAAGAPLVGAPLVRSLSAQYSARLALQERVAAAASLASAGPVPASDSFRAYTQACAGSTTLGTDLVCA